MKNMYFVGTLHGYTPKNELESILNNLKPSQVMVEIKQKDIEQNNLNEYPEEMNFVLKWATKNRIPVFGMDATFSELAEGKTEKDNEAVIAMQDKIIKKHDWKSFNKEKNLRLLEIPELDKLIDDKLATKREKEMLENITKNAISTGNVAILTGVGHLNFFEKELPNANFPFR